MTKALAPRTTPAEPALLDDDALVERARGGDAVAFELVMRRHNRLLFRTIRAILGNDADAEDALQETWLRAHRALATFRGDARLSTWLLRIAVNAALMRRRATRVVVPLRDDAGDEPAARDDDDRAPSPEESAARAQLRAEARRVVERHIDALAEPFRVVFMLRVVEERSVEETAAALGIPEATVRTRHFRARAQLRDALARELDVAVDDAFGFDGARCDRVVAHVLAHIAR